MLYVGKPLLFEFQYLPPLFSVVGFSTEYLGFYV